MKKLLAATAAAALLCTGGVAVAKKPKPVTVNVSFTFSGTTVNCALIVTPGSDKKHGFSNNILLTANSSACGFVGEGVIATANESKTNATNLAIISGYDSLAAQYFGYQALEVLLEVGDNGDFVSGNNYTVYATSDGSKQTYIGKGTYTVGN